MSDDAVDDWNAGLISAEVALARLILAGRDPAETSLAAEAARHGPGLARIARMVKEADVRHGGSEASPEEALASVRSMFDRAATVSPEGSVAAYSLADPALLRAATDELVAWLHNQGLLRAETEALDFGSGIGRVAAAIAPLLRSVIGLDVSPEMTRLARERAPADNVSFATTSGLNLSTIGDETIDLVLAVDSFPYVVQAGLGLPMLAEFSRVLRPVGACVLFNVTYGDDVDLRDWARAAGLAVTLADARPFTRWDAKVFKLEKC